MTLFGLTAPAESFILGALIIWICAAAAGAVVRDHYATDRAAQARVYAAVSAVADAGRGSWKAADDQGSDAS